MNGSFKVLNVSKQAYKLHPGECVTAGLLFNRLAVHTWISGAVK